MATSHQVATSHSEAKLDVAEQTFDDARSLQRRQSHDGESRRHHHLSKTDSSESHPAATQETLVATDPEASPTICNLFATSNIIDPFDTILSDQKSGIAQSEPVPEHPTSLPTISEPYLVSSTPTGSVYATPNGPTPSGDTSFSYSMQTSTPIASQDLPSEKVTQSMPPPMSTINLTPLPRAMAPPMSTPARNLTPFQSGVPITSPLPSFGVSPMVALPPTISNLHESVTNDDDALPQEVLRRRDAWIPSPATLRVIDSVR